MGLVHLDSKVTSITNIKGDKVKVEWSGPHGNDSREFDYCISTMAPSLLAKVVNNIRDKKKNALEAMKEVSSCKVGWQAKNRFWERENEIYGGISWTQHAIRQVWYPSNGFFNRTGVLTGAYNRGKTAEEFGDLTHVQRLQMAIEGGNKLHKNFAEKVHFDRGVSIAWQKMPFFAGGWVEEPSEQPAGVYDKITSFPDGQIYLAGDFVSHTPGWMEGSVRSAYRAIENIAKRVKAIKNAAA